MLHNALYIIESSEGTIEMDQCMRHHRAPTVVSVLSRPLARELSGCV